jgi:hypothetical protein
VLSRGVVATYLARRFGERAVVRVLDHDVTTTRTRDAFLASGDLPNAVDHPRVPRVLEVGTAYGEAFLRERWVDGEPLEIALFHDAPGFSVERLLRVAASALDALHAVHTRAMQ